MTIFIDRDALPMLDYALTIMEQFVADIVTEGIAAQATFAECIHWDQGAFTFVVTADGTDYKIEVPGMPLELVRFTGAPEQSYWDYPDVCVDGTPLRWTHAVAACAEEP